MSVELHAGIQHCTEGDLVERAVALLSQQIWCWGRDVLRPEGNWLIKAGFDRVAAPADRESCSSVYTLELAQGRRVVLRGFGVFFGDDRLGGVFLKRYEFQPRYTPQPTLECPPWSSEDLPVLNAPTEYQRDSLVLLTVEVIDWIRAYEVNITECLGIEYRQSTLETWENNKRPIIPAEEMASSWRTLGLVFAENYQTLVV